MFKHTILFAAVVGLVLGLSGTARATDGTWIRTTDPNSNWSNTANWQGGIIADGVGATATLVGGGNSNNYGIDGLTVDYDVTLGYWDETPSGGWAAVYSSNGAKLTWDTGNPAVDATMQHGDDNYTNHIVMDMDLQSNLVLTGSTQRGLGDPPNSEGAGIFSTISGPGSFTINFFHINWDGENNCKFRITGGSPNTYSGGTYLNQRQNTSSYNDGNIVKDWNRTILMKDGSFGTGDVTMMNPIVKIRIQNDSADPEGDGDNRLSDTGNIYLVYGPPVNTRRLIIAPTTLEYSLIELDANVHEVVGGLYFEDLVAATGPIAQALGTWGATGSLDKFGNSPTYINDNYFMGKGVLEVIPEPATLALLGLGGIAMLIRRKR